MDLVERDYKIPDITEQEFELFRKLIFELAGVHMNETKKPLIRGRLLKRIRHYGFSTYMDYYRLIRGLPAGSDEIYLLVDLLTTHETYFFREPEHFNFLRNYLKEQRGEIVGMHLWIAASSTGEEAYSAAMVLDEVLGDRVPWSIMASDVSRGVLEIAESAVYAMDRTTKIPQNYLKKYCLRGVRSQEGLLTVIPELKKKIQFKQVNLMEDWRFRDTFDVIFLRNVMIYFNYETKLDLLHRIVKKIKKGGFLIVGYSESLNVMSPELKWIQQSVYQKI